MNILEKCVEELAMLLFSSDAEGLVTGCFTQAELQYRIESEIMKGVGTTKCRFIKRRISRSALCSSLPMYAVVEMIDDDLDFRADGNGNHGAHCPP